MFEQGNKLYEQGRYTEAAAVYEQMLGSGKASAALYFNLGNSWFKAGQLGRAIAAYRQAKGLSPRDPDILANLQFARNQSGGATLRPDRVERTLSRLSLDEWTWLAFGTAWLALLLLALQQWNPRLRYSLRALTAVFIVFAIALAGCLFAALRRSGTDVIAVVIVPSAEVRHGPLEESQTAFSVRDGAELRLLDEKDSWVRVTTGARQTGWLPRKTVLIVGGASREATRRQLPGSKPASSASANVP
jgi:tetratricopeptide (TPR) repeat protein